MTAINPEDLEFSRCGLCEQSQRICSDCTIRHVQWSAALRKLQLASTPDDPKEYLQKAQLVIDRLVADLNESRHTELSNNAHRVSELISAALIGMIKAGS